LFKIISSFIDEFPNMAYPDRTDHDWMSALH